MLHHLDQGLGEPIPPANSIPDATRALAGILSALRSDTALAALRSGDATAVVDAYLWAPAWEGARVMRPAFIIGLARTTKQAFLADLKAKPQGSISTDERSKILFDRLRIAMDFSFRFLQPVHLAMLADTLMLCLPDGHIGTDGISMLLANAANASPFKTPDLTQAVILGASGSHFFQTERLLALDPSAGRP